MLCKASWSGSPQPGLSVTPLGSSSLVSIEQVAHTGAVASEYNFSISSECSALQKKEIPDFSSFFC